MDEPREDPEFGPSGYLPERASKRARKIVLRAPLGLQWVVGSLVVGLVVVVAGVLLLNRPATPPPAPFAALDLGLDALAPAQQVTLDGSPDPVLVVASGGLPRAFVLPDGPTPQWCDRSGLLEAPGAAWRPTGRGVQGTASLAELPSTVLDGVLYVDPTRPATPASPDRGGPTPACGS